MFWLWLSFCCFSSCFFFLYVYFFLLFSRTKTSTLAATVGWSPSSIPSPPWTFLHPPKSSPALLHPVMHQQSVVLLRLLSQESLAYIAVMGIHPMLLKVGASLKVLIRKLKCDPYDSYIKVAQKNRQLTKLVIFLSPCM